MLFCGSIYVLLGTNLGARLGFLVAFTGLMGFMVILSLLWCTTASPLNTLKGRIPQWKVQEVVTSPEKSKIDAVHGIQKKAEPRRPHRGGEREGRRRRRARAQGSHAHRAARAERQQLRDREFTDVTKYMILNTFEVGGSNPQFWKLQFTHDPLYAVVAVLRSQPTGSRPAERVCPAPARVRPRRRERVTSSCPVTSGRCGCPRSSPS